MRYWPDYGLTIIVDNREVTNVGETTNGDFIIREFELEEDPVSNNLFFFLHIVCFQGNGSHADKKISNVLYFKANDPFK